MVYLVKDSGYDMVKQFLKRLKKTTYVRGNVKKRFEFRCLMAERSQELKNVESGIYEKLKSRLTILCFSVKYRYGKCSKIRETSYLNEI